MIKLILNCGHVKDWPAYAAEQYDIWKNTPYDLVNTFGIDAFSLCRRNGIPYVLWGGLIPLSNFCERVLPIRLSWAAIREKDSRLLLVFKKRDPEDFLNPVTSFSNSTITVLLLDAFIGFCYPNLECVHPIERHETFLYTELIDRRQPADPVKPEHDFYIRKYCAKYNVWPNTLTLAKKETTKGDQNGERI